LYNILEKVKNNLGKLSKKLLPRSLRLTREVSAAPPHEARADTRRRQSFDEALAEQDTALAMFRGLVERCPEALWRRSRGRGRWDLATISLHVVLTLDRVHEALTRDPPALVPEAAERRPAALFLLRAVSRVVLRLRFIPRRGIRAPATFIPRGPALPRESLLREIDRLREESRAAYARFLADPAPPRMIHPVLGALEMREWPRIQAIHVEHHARQLVRELSRAGDRTAP
jgi:hypothetical protein